MTWTTLTMQVTTPLFNGGAENGGDDGTGIRVASIRGAMRFWFRALAGALTGPDLQLLGALERRVFGGAAPRRGEGDASVPSPLLLRIESPPSATKAYKFPSGQTGNSIGYLLGLGLMRPSRQGPLLERPCVPPGRDSTFKLKIGFRHPRSATPEMREAIEALSLASLWCACTYGGFGARVRRGFGGVRIAGALGAETLPHPWNAEGNLRTPALGFYENATKIWPAGPVAQCMKHFGVLAQGAKFGGPSWGEDPPTFPVMSKTFSPAVFVPHPPWGSQSSFGSWEEVLSYAGRQLRLFRANEPSRAQDRESMRVRTAEWDDVVNDGEGSEFPLGALGLPVGYHNKLTDRKYMVNAVEPAKTPPEEMRRASPLWLRPVGSGGSWGLLTFAFQTAFLPGRDQARVHLIQEGRPNKELDVFQQDVIRLTSQWLKTLNDGGDFTTVLRD